MSGRHGQGFELTSAFGGRIRACVVLRQVCDQPDVCDDQLVLQEQVLEEDVLLLRRHGLRAEQAPQRLRASPPHTGSTGAAGLVLWETQRLQDAVLT